MASKDNLKKLWDNYAAVGEVKKSDKIKFVIGAGIRDGVRYLNIREFYYNKTEEVWKPGRDGITIPLKTLINNGTETIEPYKDFIEALEKASDTLSNMALEDEENAVYVEPKRRG